MDAACAKALEQIEEKDYVDRLRQDGMRNFIKYGIACFKKDCKVWLENNKNLSLQTAEDMLDFYTS